LPTGGSAPIRGASAATPTSTPLRWSTGHSSSRGPQAESSTHSTPPTATPRGRPQPALTSPPLTSVRRPSR
jgi:hypothetical protein